MRVMLHVDSGEAIRHGKTNVGEQPIELSDEDLQRLTRVEREMLADAQSRGPLGKGIKYGERMYQDPPIAEATFDALRAILQARAKAKAEHKREMARLAVAAEQWIEAHGTAKQKRDFAAHILPVTEVRDLVREQLFSSLAPYKRLYRMKFDEVVCDCRKGRRYVVFETHRNSEIVTPRPPPVGETLRKIIDDAPPGAVSELREHVGRCRGCGAIARRWGLAITVHWGRIPLNIEYALDHKGDTNE